MERRFVLQLRAHTFLRVLDPLLDRLWHNIFSNFLALEADKEVFVPVLDFLLLVEADRSFTHQVWEATHRERDILGT